MQKLSDRRPQENMRQVGWTYDGVPLYSFNYVGDPVERIGVANADADALGDGGQYIGLMADDLEKSCPEAVRVVSTDAEVTAAYSNTFGKAPNADQLETFRNIKTVDYGAAIKRSLKATR